MGSRARPAALDEPKPIVCSKDLLNPSSHHAKISGLDFCVQSPEEIQAASVLQVYANTLYLMPQRTPVEHGVLDLRLGVSNKNKRCATCGLQLKECAGHFGYIKLPLPVFHQGYFMTILKVLQCICKTCGRVLLPEEDRFQVLRKLKNRPKERGSNKGIIRKLSEKCKTVKICPYCSSYNGGCKKLIGTYKIIHDPYSKNLEHKEDFLQTFDTVRERNAAAEPFLDKAVDDLNPARVLRLFHKVLDEDLPLLDLGCRPETLLVTYLAVPPVCIRPSVEMDTGGGTNEDDATTRLLAVCDMSISIRKSLDMGIASMENIMEQWDFLQVQCALYINSEHRLSLEYQKHNSKTHSRGFVQRLKGKQGRFRGNLSGKRVDYTGRTVISPDPNLKINEVCVPMHMARILTFPERVTRHNMEDLKRCVVRGPAWPGANVLQLTTGETFILRVAKRREQLANALKVGDIVERHCNNTDIILFNRQPSLHRISIMAFRVNVMPWRTLRFNECVCAPFNADFDGDEMNLHLPQTQEARAEALLLMGSHANLCTPKNGEVMVCATQDFLTAGYMLTSKDRFFSRAELAQLCAGAGGALDQMDPPAPAVIKPLELWTGKQVFSMLVRPSIHTGIYVNIEIKEKIYTGSKSNPCLHMCPKDGFACFINSELISGRIGKTTLGGSKKGLFGTLNSQYGPESAGIIMCRLSKLSARWMGELGFSIGITDVTPADILNERKGAAIDKGNAECDEYITAFNRGKLDLLPGCNEIQTLESKVQGVLNEIRDIAGKVCMSTLHYHNATLVMASCGSKGSAINIAQMVACVGQQSVGGKRCADGFKGRTTPHFPKGDKSPSGKGFVANSFYSGLTATEFFFHTMGGREGLVDTAVKTAETGYMSRRLMKSLEDLYMGYDMTVRNSSGGIIQLVYGDDHLDPLLMEGPNASPLDLPALAREVVHSTRVPGVPLEERSLAVPLPAALAPLIDAAFAIPALQAAAKGLETKPDETHSSVSFRESLRSLVDTQAATYAADRSAVGLPPSSRGDPFLEYLCGIPVLTPPQLTSLLSTALAKCGAKVTEPSTCVGAIAAQSIGEPGTQMTLKTFHFAGVASMNVTLGVPRIKEIINAAKTITTPVMDVRLEVDSEEMAARLVKGRLEKTLLGDVCRDIKIVFSERDPCVVVTLNMPLIASLELDINAYTVKRSLCAARLRPKIKDVKVQEIRADKLLIHAPDDSRENLVASLQLLLRVVPLVSVSGVPTIVRAVIQRVEPEASVVAAEVAKADALQAGKDAAAAERAAKAAARGVTFKDDKKGIDLLPPVPKRLPKAARTKFQLAVEGCDFRSVMTCVGVDGPNTTTNHIAEIEIVLGVEAARTKIQQEIRYIFDQYGMGIDHRHIMLLADLMTYKGLVLGITRFGLVDMKESILHSASFERTTDQLFDAASRNLHDHVTGVSESIILGLQMPIGTGLFDLRYQSDMALPPPRPEPLMAA